DAVLLIDAARPVAGERVFQGLGLAEAGERLALDVADEGVDPLEDLAIGLLPVEVVLPRALGENELHSASSRSRPPPRSNSASASRRRRALRGLRSRWVVSSSAS